MSFPTSFPFMIPPQRFPEGFFGSLPPLTVANLFVVALLHALAKLVIHPVPFVSVQKPPAKCAAAPGAFLIVSALIYILLFRLRP